MHCLLLVISAVLSPAALEIKIFVVKFDSEQYDGLFHISDYGITD